MDTATPLRLEVLTIFMIKFCILGGFIPCLIVELIQNLVSGRNPNLPCGTKVMSGALLQNVKINFT